VNDWTLFWLNDREMPTVQCCDISRAGPFCRSNDKGIDGTERKVRVLLHQLGSPAIVCGPEIE
jgi:hypothetical protein